MNEPTPQSNEVILSGFHNEEKVFAESVREECKAILTKLQREAPVRSLELYMKNSIHGKSRIFDIRATARLDKGALHAAASARELNVAIRRAFSELSAQASRMSGYKAGIHAKETKR
ncbi:MAG: hypothetical protein WC408_03145 [Candidatus Micrarchaeia archaeon]|jgi:ribosome-associated translation inhibitor RaiA